MNPFLAALSFLYIVFVVFPLLVVYARVPFLAPLARRLVELALSVYDYD